MAECASILVDVAVDDQVVAETLAYLEFLLLDKAKRNRKTDYVSVYLVNCPHTENSQQVDNIYQISNFEAPITVDIAVDLVGKLRDLTSAEGVGKGYQGGNNVLQALLLASLDLKAFAKRRKMVRQIMVFTDKVAELDLTKDEIVTMRQELDSRIILVNCSDNAKNEYTGSTWEELVNSVDGSLVFTIDDLLHRIAQPVPKVVKPVSVFQGQLRLGADLEGIVDLRAEPLAGENKRKFAYMYEAESRNEEDPLCLCIGVRGFPATKKVNSVQRVRAIRKQPEDSHGPQDYIPVKSVIQYEVGGDKKDTSFTVANESLTKAYRYGSDYVVLPSSLENELIYHTYAGLDIRGFMDSNKLERQLLTSESVFILPTDQDANQTSFAALVDAMRRIDKVAVARYVPKNNSSVYMVMLYPMILENEDRQNVRVLILNPLPFAEDDNTTLYPRLKVDKNEKADEMMEQFVKSRDWDHLTHVPENKYYDFFKDTNRDTLLPLPLLDHEQSRQRDPLLVPALVHHRQQQVLLEYIHQVLINKSDTFHVPEISSALLEKISPRISYKYPVEELVKLLQIKKVEPKTTVTKVTPAEPVPSLETLLRRGEEERKG